MANQRNKYLEEMRLMPPEPKGKKKVEIVMDEFKKGKLNSSAGPKVKNRKQAIAIALSEQRRAEKK